MVILIFLAQADTHQSVVWHVGMVPIGVEGHAFLRRRGGCCTEVRRFGIMTPTVTLLVTITRVTGNEEAGVEPIFTDQQLLGVSATHGAHAVPQSISASLLPIVTSGRYGHLSTSIEVSLVSRLVINEDYFSELKRKKSDKN